MKAPTLSLSSLLLFFDVFVIQHEASYFTIKYNDNDVELIKKRKGG